MVGRNIGEKRSPVKIVSRHGPRGREYGTARLGGGTHRVLTDGAKPRPSWRRDRRGVRPTDAAREDLETAASEPQEADRAVRARRQAAGEQPARGLVKPETD